MVNTEFDLENVIPMTEANLRDEQKQAIAKAMEDYKQQCLKSFSINKSSEVIQKEELPALQADMVDSAINRALINQASVLSNTVFNAVARTFKEGQLPQNYVGPAHHQPRSPVVTAPSATTAAAGVEATSPPSTLIGVTDVQSTSMMANPSTLDGQIKLATDLLASAMS